jgi:hypothetical protein
MRYKDLETLVCPSGHMEVVDPPATRPELLTRSLRLPPPQTEPSPRELAIVAAGSGAAAALLVELARLIAG